MGMCITQCEWSRVLQETRVSLLRKKIPWINEDWTKVNYPILYTNHLPGSNLTDDKQEPECFCSLLTRMSGYVTPLWIDIPLPDNWMSARRESENKYVCVYKSMFLKWIWYKKSQTGPIYTLSKGLRRETHLFQDNFCLHLCLFIHNPLHNLSTCVSFPSEIEEAEFYVKHSKDFKLVFFLLSIALKYLYIKNKTKKKLLA